MHGTDAVLPHPTACSGVRYWPPQRLTRRLSPPHVRGTATISFSTLRGSTFLSLRASKLEQPDTPGNDTAPVLAPASLSGVPPLSSQPQSVSCSRLGAWKCCKQSGLGRSSMQGSHVSCSWCTAAAAAHPEGPPDIGSRKIAAEYKLWWSTSGQPLPDDRDYWDKSCANHVCSNASVISLICNVRCMLSLVHHSGPPLHAEAQQHARLCS